VLALGAAGPDAAKAIQTLAATVADFHK